MTRNFASTAWSLPLTALASVALAGCSGGAATSDPSDAAADAADDSAQKSFPDSGMKMAPDSAMKMPPMDASPPGDGGGSNPPDAGGTSPPDAGGPPGSDASTKPPADAASPTPDAGQPPSTPGSVMCGGAPCDVSHGFFCCVTVSDGGASEACKPPNAACGGFRLDCDEKADCALGGVCCQDFPSVAVAGSASCKASCPTQICRTDDECCPLGGDGGSGRCLPQQCTGGAPPFSLFVQACAIHGLSPDDTLSPACKPMFPF